MENILSENRAKGWLALPESAPSWVRQFVSEFRYAALAERRMSPTFMRAFVQDAEQRSSMREQIERFNRTHAPIIPRSRPATKKSPTVTLSSDEARKLAKEYGVSLQDVVVAQSLEQTAGVPKEDTLARIRLRADAARIARAKQLQDEDDFSDDPDDEWDADRHAREATRHRTLAQKSNFEDGCAHLKCADAHSYASNNFSTDNSRKARKRSRLAFPESVIS
jgi:hypothetical protein